MTTFNHNLKFTTKSGIVSRLRYRIVGLILSCGIFLSFVYGSVFYTQARNELDRQSKIYNENRLASASNYITITLENLSGMMAMIGRDANIFSQGISNLSNYNDVLLTLRKSVEQTEIVSKAFVYAKRGDRVFSSDFVYCDAEDSQHYDIIRAYHSTSCPQTAMMVDGKKLCIFLFGDGLYLAQDYLFYSDASFGTVFFRVDTDVLYRGLDTKKSDSDISLYVYGPNMEPIFTQIQYPSINAADFLPLVDDTETTISGYSCLRSDETGWIFLAQNGYANHLGNAFLLKMLLIVSAVMLIEGILIWYIMRNVFLPLDSLIGSINTGAVGEYADEMDLLYKAVSSMTKSQVLLENSLHNMLPRVANKFYSDLINGQNFDEEYIRRVLPVIGKEFSYNGGFVVCIYKERVETAEVGFAKVQIAIDEALLPFESSIAGRRLHCEPEKKEFVLIMQFSGSIPSDSIGMCWRQISIAISRRLSERQYNMQWAYSQSFTSFVDIGIAYSEAKTYLIQHPHFTILNDEIQLPEDVDDDYAFFYSRLKKATEQLLSSDAAAAGSLFDSCVHALTNNSGNKEAFAAFSSAVTNACLDCLQPSGSCDLSFDRLRQLWGGDPFSLTNFLLEMNAFKSAWFDYLIDKQKKRTHKLLVAAESYIGNNFSDISLSLGMVAAKVGASPNYLSRLFNNNLDISFVDYLNWVRIGAACRLLESSELTTKDIAAKVGYASQQTFFRAFKKITGGTPKEYKANRK